MPILDRVLAGAGQPRLIEPGVYGVTDLLRHSAQAVARWHLGLEAPQGIPPWLAKRGKAIEAGLLDVVPDTQKDLVLRLELDDGCTIQGHPDYLWDPDGEWELGEAKSGLSDDEQEKEAQALDQALSYVALHDEGATVAHDRGLSARVPEPGGIGVVNILQGGLWDAGEAPYRVDRTATAALLDHLTDKATVLSECLSEQTLDPAIEWDQDNRPWSVDEVHPVPEDEWGQLADETVQVFRDYRALKQMYDELRDRWFETLDLGICRKVRAPGGGLVGLVRSRELDRPAFEEAARELLDEQARLRKRVEAARSEAQARVRRQCREELARLAELEERIEAVREGHVREVKGHVRVYAD